MRYYDGDGSGSLDWHEFRALFAQLQQWQAMYLAEKAAHFAAAGGDGRLGPRFFVERLARVHLPGFLFSDPLQDAVCSTLLANLTAVEPGRPAVEDVSFGTFCKLMAQVMLLVRLFEQFDPARSGKLSIDKMGLITIFLQCSC